MGEVADGVGGVGGSGGVFDVLVVGERLVVVGLWLAAFVVAPLTFFVFSFVGLWGGVVVWLWFLLAAGVFCVWRAGGRLGGLWGGVRAFGFGVFGWVGVMEMVFG